MKYQEESSQCWRKMKEKDILYEILRPIKLQWLYTVSQCCNGTKINKQTCEIAWLNQKYRHAHAITPQAHWKGSGVFNNNAGSIGYLREETKAKQVGNRSKYER